MVDNFALFVSQLMMIVVLWRCYTMPVEDGGDAPRKPAFRAKRTGAADTSDETRRD